MKNVSRALGVLVVTGALLSAATVATAAPAKRAGFKGGVVHADVTKVTAKGKTTSTTLDRGDVTASSRTAISLKRADGKTVTLGVDAKTKVLGQAAVGKRALVVSRQGTAVLVLSRGAARAAIAMGRRLDVRGLRLARGAVHADVSLVKADGSTDSFAFDRGQVTAATASSVTIERRDGKSVKLGIGQSTVIRARGTAGQGTLAVGQTVKAFSRDGTAFLIRVHQPKA